MDTELQEPKQALLKSEPYGRTAVRPYNFMLLRVEFDVRGRQAMLTSILSRRDSRR